MKLSEQWLLEWINPHLTREELSSKLTMAGLEIDGLSPVAGTFSNVVVGHVTHVEKHPEADRLKVCLVDVGQPEQLTIVCGAANVRAGLKVAAALIGALLPNDFKISRSKIRNVVSHGMLCSARELGMSDESNGIIELPQDAPIGTDITQYLNLSDYVIDVAITPNRGDCLSIFGMAKEISALTGAVVTSPDFTAAKPSTSAQIPVIVDLPKECPRYAGRIINKVKADAVTPVWMQERLRRGGIRCISPIVDVMNYVMLELGQPMHAFDLLEINGGIQVRKANAGEELTLLDGQTISLSPHTMVIADQKKPLAIAGVMGGLDSGVTLLTQDIFLESAFFSAESIAQSSRHYLLNSESSYRFERGIDPSLQVIALERATQLLLDIVGGQPGPVIEVTDETHLPSSKQIQLRRQRLDSILGIHINDAEIEHFLQSLTFQVTKNSEGWQVLVPARRHDVSLEIDLIEEMIRLYGYDKLPQEQAISTLQINPVSDQRLHVATLRRGLSDLGYQEVITYSFIDKNLQHLFDPVNQPKELLNPISADMAVMRTNLWPGLVNTLIYNQNRQQSRVRIFETGLRFIQNEAELLQQRVVSGLLSGTAYPEQWGIPERPVDFFDLKGDLQNLFKLTVSASEFSFKKGSHPALHPGQTAEIYRNDQFIGLCGALHPLVMQTLGISEKVFLFELLLDHLEVAKKPQFSEISKFPEIRRDIAIFVDLTVPSQAIQDTIREVGGELLRDITVFDVYQGKGVAPHQKSIALALTLQHSSRTLIDEEVADIVERVIVVLKDRFAAELRG